MHIGILQYMHIYYSILPNQTWNQYKYPISCLVMTEVEELQLGKKEGINI